MLAAIDNWLFLLFLAIAGLLKLLSKAAGSKQTPDQPDESTFPKPDRKQQSSRPPSDEEQIRKFLEALGQPRTAKPPAPVTPRTDVAPRPLAPVSPPPTVIRPFPKTRQATEPAPTRTPSRPVPPPIPRRVFQPAPAAESPSPPLVFEVQQTRAAQPIPSAAIGTGDNISVSIESGDLMQMLRSPNALQQAIVLREIFGPPRGLQPLEDPVGTA